MVTQYFSKVYGTRFYECLVCKEAIYNPLCPTCLAGQIKVWLTNYPDLSKKIMPILKKFIQEAHNEIDHLATRCIACNKKQASVCPYCFTEHVLNQLKKLDVDKQVLREFLQFFNFDYDRKGYTEEAEELGLIW